MELREQILQVISEHWSTVQLIRADQPSSIRKLTFGGICSYFKGFLLVLNCK